MRIRLVGELSWNGRGTAKTTDIKSGTHIANIMRDLISLHMNHTIAGSLAKKKKNRISQRRWGLIQREHS